MNLCPQIGFARQVSQVSGTPGGYARRVNQPNTTNRGAGSRRPQNGFMQSMREAGALFFYDAFAWAAGILAALALRYDFVLHSIHWGWAVVLIAITIVLQLVAGWVFWLYRCLLYTSRCV